MIKELILREPYIFIPISRTDETGKLWISLSERGRVMELSVPLFNGEISYYAKLSLTEYFLNDNCSNSNNSNNSSNSNNSNNGNNDNRNNEDKIISIETSWEDEAFFDELRTNEVKFDICEKRPRYHFTAQYGWMNDPNGLVKYKDEYLLYYQHNPYDIKWNNMCWGHAKSKDLFNWEYLDDVLFPDENGMIYSGSGVCVQEKDMEFKKEDLVFFYSSAINPEYFGKKRFIFNQRIAVSSDGGATLNKLDTEALGEIEEQSRDPKVFWHEESDAYIMVLWLKEDIYGIFRSENLKEWYESDRVRLEGAFECPDLFYFIDENKNEHRNEKRRKQWFFWCAHGYYYPGEFDGYSFKQTGNRGRYYISDYAYAAQTFAGTDSRVIQMPWIKLRNDGRLFTGCLGIPVEIRMERDEDNYLLSAYPVHEFFENLFNDKESDVIVAELDIDKDFMGKVDFLVNGQGFSYMPSEMKLEISRKKREINITYDENKSFSDEVNTEMFLGIARDVFDVGIDARKLLVIIDDSILEIYFEHGKKLGIFELDSFFESFEVVTGEGVTVKLIGERDEVL